MCGDGNGKKLEINDEGCLSPGPLLVLHSAGDIFSERVQCQGTAMCQDCPIFPNGTKVCKSSTLSGSLTAGCPLPQLAEGLCSHWGGQPTDYLLGLVIPVGLGGPSEDQACR